MGLKNFEGNRNVADQYRGFRYAIMQPADFMATTTVQRPATITSNDGHADKYAYDILTDRCLQKSVDQGKTAFEPHELADFVQRVSSLPDSAESATCLAFIGLTRQSSSRPWQLCEVHSGNAQGS